VTALGSFPLVPFSNRIRDGRFDFAGRRHQLPRSFAAVAHPLHGHGWQSAWTLTEHSAACAELLLRHPADDWPWRYWARQRFTLDDSGLHHELDLHNDSDEPMPAGVGLHPYFVRSADVRLFAQLPQVWPTDADCLPSAAVATPAAWDFTAGRRIAELALDHCFSGWDGRAVIDWPTARCRLVIDAAPPLTTLVIYSPAGGDFFCVEPVSHVTDAINLSQRGVSGTGAAVLLPGQTLHASTRFGIELY
jgi:aldose 1-epimerase